MKNKKKVILLGVGLVVLLIVLPIIGTKMISDGNHNVQVKENDDEKVFSTGLALMVETTPGLGDYVRTEDTSWAELAMQGYVLNKERSTCKNGSTLSWNDEDKTIIFSGAFADSCSVYFDILTLVKHITNDLFNEDGERDLYYHDGIGTYVNSNLEIGDNSYRYAGADPNNYLCFNEGCSDDEKYRIIGVINGKAKVIKMTNDGSRAWNANQDAEGNYIRTWEGSTMESYLNGEYLTGLGDIADLIDTTIWRVRGFEANKIKIPHTIKDTYIAELSTSEVIERKIGLMYVSDYLYAVHPTYWNLVGLNENDTTLDYRVSRGHDWMLTSTEWTISCIFNYTNSAFSVYSNGSVNSHSIYNPYGTRPVFSLLPSTRLKSGFGTSAEPYIVGR